MAYRAATVISAMALFLSCPRVEEGSRTCVHWDDQPARSQNSKRAP